MYALVLTLDILFWYSMSIEVFTMATKSANVMARVEPDIKAKAEAILARLGIPASVVINALYHQII